MPTVPSSVEDVNSTASNFQQIIRARLDSLSYLSTTVAVAVKLVELGKDLEAEPADYARVISADSSLSSKLLALANSSWAGVRQKVTTVKTAVNLLGLGTVRTLAISYCMTGLHNELRLAPEESEAFWEASLSKAVAAKRFASMFDPKIADEAFVVGLFQDLALTILYSIVRGPYRALLENPQVGVAEQIEKERAVFGVDHAEVGRDLGRRLQIPEVFVDTVAFHHDYQRLTELVASQPLRDATYVAALFPHMLNDWKKNDADTCAAFLTEHAPSTSMDRYVADVQQEFAEVCTFFNEGKTPAGRLTELLEQTARDVADNTAVLVGRVNELLEEAATTGVTVGVRTQALVDEADYDKLTGALSRHGFTRRAKELLTQAARFGTGFGFCYLDIDKFKPVNDRHGHSVGDQALRAVVDQIRAAVSEEALIGRLGGDEFAVLLTACGRQDAIDMAEEIVSAIAATSIQQDGQTIQLSSSVGLVFVKASDRVQQFDMLLNAADKLMYAAKRNGGNQVETRVV